MKEIPLTRGFRAMVDDEDYSRLAGMAWSPLQVRGRISARHSQYRQGTYPLTIWMHHLVLPPKLGFVVDHINRNALDNRRANLRYATRGQNRANSRKNLGATSQFRGVCWNKAAGLWRAELRAGPRHYYLGDFVLEETAAKAYDQAAKQEFGQFASLNFL